jgi:hypothetical protein
MALEEFIIDLCEESVNGALLVGFSIPCLLSRVAANIRLADFLAIPDIPPRPRERAKLNRIQDVSEDIQQGAAHRVRVGGAPAEGEDQGEHTARHRTLELGACEYSGAISTTTCGTIGHCAGAETETR